MDINMLILMMGLFCMVGGPFLAIYAYYQGNDGPTCFAAMLIITVLGVGLVSGFAR
jgi:magnesium-transporting ATPase (P-type)